MNRRRLPVTLAAVTLTLATLTLGPAPAGALPARSVVHNKVDIVFVSPRPADAAADATPAEWKSEDVIWEEIQAAAAYYAEETGVDFQFVDPTFRHLYVDPELCAGTWATIDWDGIYAAFGTQESDYTARGTGANRHLFGIFHRSCYTGAQSFTKANPGTLDTGGRVVINDRDIDAWPDFNFYLLVHELGHTFGFEHVFTEVCEQATEPAALDWDQAAQADPGVTCSSDGSLWVAEGLQGENTPVDERTDVHLTGYFKYELGVIARDQGATVINRPTVGTTVTLAALPTTDTSDWTVNQTVLVKVPGGTTDLPATAPWSDGGNLTLAVEYYGDAGALGVHGDTGVYVTALLWDGVGRDFSEAVVLQPVTGPSRHQHSLAPGETLTAAGGRVRITTESVDGATATVRIEVDAVESVPTYRAQADIVLIQGSDEPVFHDPDLTWVEAWGEDVLAVVLGEAATVSDEFGVDWQFTDPRVTTLTVEPGTCADLDQLLSAYGHDAAYYTEGDVNRFLIGIYDPDSCEDIRTYHYFEPDPATMDTGGILVYPQGWASKHMLGGLVQSFGVAETRAARCAADSLTAPSWDMADGAAATTCTDVYDPWAATNAQIWAGSTARAPLRIHVTALEKYAAGAIADGQGAVVIEDAGVDQVVDLVQVPAAAAAGNQAVIIRHDGAATTGTVPYADATDAVIGVEYRTNWSTLTPAGVYVTVATPKDAGHLAESYLLQPIGGPQDAWVPLGVGETFTTADGRVHVTVESVSADQAQVRVVVDEDTTGDSPSPLDTFLETLRQIFAKMAALIKRLLALFG